MPAKCILRGEKADKNREKERITFMKSPFLHTFSKFVNNSRKLKFRPIIVQ